MQKNQLKKMRVHRITFFDPIIREGNFKVNLRKGTEDVAGDTSKRNVAGGLHFQQQTLEMKMKFISAIIPRNLGNQRRKRRLATRTSIVKED